ncbi:uncharacterized protein LOC122720318 [Apis laboriosa]|uniref:uncharacterized protein LOC122720318 n=1 Tax=Apis laboriosa TaxID=183418 RepID=UPI001CC45805|nr:uncharacterized protein LOC122720318 [Apis laboriosa]
MVTLCMHTQWLPAYRGACHDLELSYRPFAATRSMQTFTGVRNRRLGRVKRRCARIAAWRVSPSIPGERTILDKGTWTYRNFLWTEDGENRPTATSYPVRAAPATLRPSIAEWRQKRSSGEERDKSSTRSLSSNLPLL